MKYLLMTCFIFCAGFAAAAAEADCTRYVDQTYRYSVCVPEKWSRSYREGDVANVLRLFRRDGAKITVSASRYEGDNRTRWENPRRWHARTIGTGYLKVIDSKEIAVGGNVSIRIHVVDYRTRAGKILQRTMLMKYGDALLSVECRAPLKVFARHTERFNAFMSGVDVSGDLQGEPMELLKSPDRKPAPAARKQREPEPKPEPKVIIQPEPEVIKQPELKPEPVPAPAEEMKPLVEEDPNGENRPDAQINRIDDNKTDTKMKPESGAETMKAPEPEAVTDPATKLYMDDERNKIQKLEQDGIIEKINE